jgi:hypothetical protein
MHRLADNAPRAQKGPTPGITVPADETIQRFNSTLPNNPDRRHRAQRARRRQWFGLFFVCPNDPEL